jgi:hypothetical protein
VVQLLRLFKTFQPTEAIAIAELNVGKKVKSELDSKLRIQPRCGGSTVQMFKSSSVILSCSNRRLTAHMRSGSRVKLMSPFLAVK